MKKLLFSAFCCSLFLVGCSSEHKISESKEPNYLVFQNGYRLEYPDYFQDINVTDNGNFVRLSASGKNTYMQITVLGKKQSVSDMQKFTERGWHKGIDSLASSEREFYYDDLKRSPNPNVQNCTFSYIYNFPREDMIISLLYQVTDSNWKGDDQYLCTVYDNPQYAFHMRQIDTIVTQFQP